MEWRREAEDAVGMVLKKDEGRVETSFATCRGKHLGGERDAACKLRPQRLRNPSMNNKVHNQRTTRPMRTRDKEMAGKGNRANLDVCSFLSDASI